MNKYVYLTFYTYWSAAKLDTILNEKSNLIKKELELAQTYFQKWMVIQ